MTNAPLCSTCRRGALQVALVRRMPGAVVVLGFLLFVASILGAAAGTVMLYGSKVVEEQARKTPAEVRAELQKVSLPEPLIDKAMGEGLSEQELAGLDRSQQVAVQMVAVGKLGERESLQEITSGSKFLLGISLLGIVGGWLLRSKKSALRCDECGTVARPS